MTLGRRPLPRPPPSLAAAAPLLLVAAAALIVGWSAGAASAGSGAAVATRPGRPPPVDTLVVYVFADTDPEYGPNLAFFLRHGVAPHAADGAKTLVIIQAADPAAPDSPATAAALAHTPPGVAILRRNNSCYDWGAFGWALAQPEAAPPPGRGWKGRTVGGATPSKDPSLYRFYILLNSSVRGPFLPHSVPVNTPWHRLLTRRLGVDAVRAVGPVVSCEASPWRGDAARGPWRANPHIQSWLLAVDSVGLGVLLADPHALACAADRWDAIWHGELGASAALLAAGHNIACLLPRYAGVDWRDPAAAACNQRVSPVGDGFFDGLTLHPSDTLFVKVKARLLAARHPAALAAVKLAEWADGRLLSGGADVARNAFVNDPATHKLPRVAALRARGAACFDAAYYRAANPDLAHLDDGAAWQHAALSGQFETRDMRFTCSAASLPPALAAERERMHAHGHAEPREGAPRPRVVGRAVCRSRSPGASQRTPASSPAAASPSPSPRPRPAGPLFLLPTRSRRYTSATPPPASSHRMSTRGRAERAAAPGVAAVERVRKWELRWGEAPHAAKGRPLRVLRWEPTDETADEPGIPRFPNLTPVDDPSLPQPAARAAPPPPAAAQAEDGAVAEAVTNGGDDDTAMDE